MAIFKLKAEVVNPPKNFTRLTTEVAIAVKDAMREFGKEFLRRFKTERLTGRPGLAKRTGELSCSFDMELTGSTIKDLVLRVFSRSKYAKIHEYGGTIKPVNSQWLTIPLEAAKTRAGVARGGARDYKNTFFATSKAGNLILFQRLGKSAGGRQKRRTFVRNGVREKSDIEPLFLLVKEVTIPARLGMRDLWKTMALQRNILLRSAIRGAISQAKR